MSRFSLRAKKFEQTVDRLHERFALIPNTGYLALILDGSHAVGDSWQQGYSDYDLHAVFERPPVDIFSIVKEVTNKEVYDVTPWPVVRFSDGHGTKDLSLKLRGKTLRGNPSVLSGKLLPERDILQALTLQDLRGSSSALREMHGRLTEEKQTQTINMMRHLCYPLLKAPFVQIASLDFGLGKAYPRLRQEVVEVHPELPGLRDAHSAIANIHNRSLQDLADATILMQGVVDRVAPPL